ncbi:MAG TPA: prepilin-type N-terminal cleavage/methylation domain-containing protein [Candidatus Binatia bacterium]
MIWPIDHFRPLQQKVHGFSLLEIVVVVAIIGLLTAIAVPQFMSYRSEAIDAQLKSDLRNAAVAIEAYYAKKSVLPASVGETAGYGFQSTAGVTLSLLVVSPTAYQLTAVKAGGSQPSFTYDSATGAIH